MITKGAVKIEFGRSTYSYFQFIFSFRVSDDFPVVDSVLKSNVSYDSSENIGLFFQKNVSVIVAETDSCPTFIFVPTERSFIA